MSKFEAWDIDLLRDKIELKLKNSDIELVEIFGTGVSQKCVKYKCKKCGRIWEGKPKDVLYRDAKCQKCNTIKKTYSTDDIKNEIHRLNSDLKIINTNISPLASKKLELSCNICGCLFSRSLLQLKENPDCPNCKKLKPSPKRLDSKVLKERIESKNSNTEVLSLEYKDNAWQIRCYCKKCNAEFEATKTSLIKGGGCPSCAIELAKQRYTTPIDVLQAKVSEINPNILFLSDYICGNKKVLVSCLYDGNIWLADRKKLLAGNNCSVCNSRNSIRYNIEYVKTFISSYGHNVSLLSDKYNNVLEPLELLCNFHNFVFYRNFVEIRNGSLCPICSNSGGRKRSIEDIKIELNEISPNITILSDNLISSNSYLECFCKICGNKWNSKWSNLISGKGCPECNLKNRKGIRGTNYNPNLTEKEREFRRLQLSECGGLQLTDWRTKVFVRDNYTCINCGSRGELNAHHLDGYHWDEANRYNVDNGATLCLRCHKEFHSVYGRKYNTKEQFYEFIQENI